MTPAELPAAFHEHIVRTVRPEGFRLAPGWILSGSGELTVLAMDLTPPQIYTAMLTQAARFDAAAFIFAIDRYGRPGQGTVRSDLLAGHSCIGTINNLRPFIIEYDSATGAVDPMNFDNAYWRTSLWREMLAITAEAGAT